MNNEVTVQNLAVQAKAEGGLLISETQGYGSTDVWDDSANTVAELTTAKVRCILHQQQIQAHGIMQQVRLQIMRQMRQTQTRHQNISPQVTLLLL